MADHQSKIHRFEEDDKVVLTTEGHDHLPVGTEGVVKGFANDERTYLNVIWGTGADGEDTEEHVVTEDEVRRIG